MLEFEFNPRDVRVLAGLADAGTLGLPEFQRNFIWRPPAIADLLRTVARNWPAGSFLLLKGPQAFASKPLDGAPPLVKEPTLLVLDGQQRITALYQAFGDHSSETYFVDMRGLLEVGELEDEHVRYEKKSTFVKKHPSLKAMAQEGLITVTALANDRDFNRWLNFFSEDEQDAFVDLRDNRLSGYKSFSIPCVVLPEDVPLSALAKIFETINRTGVRLDVFDLMVAKLYPHDFRLRDQWEQAKAESPLLREFDVGGIEILKLIALFEHVRQSEGPNPTVVKGVRESDVLQLDPAAVKQQWSVAVDSYRGALEFLRGRCAVVAPGLLPARAMPLPIACALRTDEHQRHDFASDVEKWFWAATFQQVYSQGANTQAVADAKALRAWNSDSTALPRDLREFSLDADSLQDQRRRNEMLVRGLACLLTKLGARDWIQHAKKFSDRSDSIELHHIFAAQHLKNMGISEGDQVANFTPLLAPSNQSLREEPPQSVAKRQDISKSAIESHFVEWTLFAEGSWNEFLEKRSQRLGELIEEAVGK